MQWEAVSFDLFQTLVDVDQRIPAIWRRILQKDYTKEKAEQYGQDIMKEFFPLYCSASESLEFVTLEQLYQQGFLSLFQKLHLPYDFRVAANAILTEHAKAPFYPEALDALQRLSPYIPIYLSSDADFIMADGLISQVPCRKAFLSEEIRAYKRNPNGRFFQYVLSQTGIASEKMLHVGDGAADILGANRAGMQSCLIDRTGQGIPGGCRPDFVIHSLDELLNIIM